jgi:hypothetical protein
VLSAGDGVVVRLVKLESDDVEYPVRVIRDDGIHLVVRGPWAEPEARDIGVVRFEVADTFTEHYWRDRWYSIKEIRGRDGRLKGWYCDVTKPARVEPGLIVSEDLVLDLWVSPARATMLRLDEDEFEASGLRERDPEVARRALGAIEELERLVAEMAQALR